MAGPWKRGGSNCKGPRACGTDESSREHASRADPASAGTQVVALSPTAQCTRRLSSGAPRTAARFPPTRSPRRRLTLLVRQHQQTPGTSAKSHALPYNHEPGSEHGAEARSRPLPSTSVPTLSATVGQLTRRRVAEHIANRDPRGHLPLDRVGQMHGRQQITSDPDEIVVDTDSPQCRGWSAASRGCVRRARCSALDDSRGSALPRRARG